MTVFSRYLAREVYAAVLFVLVAFLALFAFFDLIGELDDVGRGSYRLQHALIYVALGLPALAYELMPIAMLIGAVYGLTQLASHSEITAIRAAGWSPWHGLKAIVLIALPLVLLTAALGEYVAPPAAKLAQQVRSGAVGVTLAKEFRSGIWVRDTVKNAAGQVERILFVNARQAQADASLSDVRVYEFDAGLRLQRISRASQARHQPGQGWLLTGISDTEFVELATAGAAQGSTSTSTAASAVRTAQAAQRLWATDLGPELLGVLSIDPGRMSVTSLTGYIRHLQENRQKSARFELALWKKIVYPFAVVVMAILALPFAFVQVRAGGIGFKVFIGIMLGVCFHFLNNLFSHLGALNTWPAPVVAVAPSALALLVGLLVLMRMSRR